MTLITPKIAVQPNMRLNQIAFMLRYGCPNKEIANTLTISIGTVKVHLKRILGVLGVNNRTQAAIVACQHWGLPNGFVAPKNETELDIAMQLAEERRKTAQATATADSIIKKYTKAAANRRHHLNTVV